MAKFGIPTERYKLTGETFVRQGVVEDFWRELGQMGGWFKQGYTQWKQQKLADDLNAVGADYLGGDGAGEGSGATGAGAKQGTKGVGGGSGGGGGAAGAGATMVMPDGSIQAVGLNGNISHYGPYTAPNGARLWNDPNRGAGDKPVFTQAEMAEAAKSSGRVYLTDIWDENSPEFAAQQEEFQAAQALREATGIAERKGYGADMTVVSPFAPSQGRKGR